MVPCLCYLYTLIQGWFDFRCFRQRPFHQALGRELPGGQVRLLRTLVRCWQTCLANMRSRHCRSMPRTTIHVLWLNSRINIGTIPSGVLKSTRSRSHTGRHSHIGLKSLRSRGLASITLSEQATTAQTFIANWSSHYWYVWITLELNRYCKWALLMLLVMCCFQGC